MKKKLTILQADLLLEQYYEGATSSEDEKRLRDFLRQPNLPERFDAERAMFGFFERERQPKGLVLRWKPALKWTVAAAVLIFGVLVVDNLQAKNNNMAWVDGKPCTDSGQVKALAIASIDQLDLASDEVAGTVDNMNDVNLVESQLQAFSE